MAKDFYKTLGVKRDASPAEIQKAYRDLARKYHPDMNPDDPKATKRFKDVQEAFDVLNTPEKRSMYDQYGTVVPPGAAAPGGNPFGGGGNPFGGGAGGQGYENVDFGQIFGDQFGRGQPGGGGGGAGGGFGDIFEQIRRATGRGGRSSAKEKRRGTDMESEVTVPLQTAVTGGQITITLQGQSGEPTTLDVKIPAGIEDGKKIRLRGQGEPGRGDPGRGGVAAGDLILTVHVAAHPFFTRKGNDLSVRLPISLAEAALGGSVDVPTPHGTVTLQIPPGTSSGKRLRVKGQGVHLAGSTPGDLFAEVQIMLPAKFDDAAREAIRAIDAEHPTTPRHNLRW